MEARTGLDGVERATREAFQAAEGLRWRSHDPFDVLLSPYLRSLPRRSALASRVAVQAGKRSGSRVRKVLRVPPHEESKTLADYLRAAVLLDSVGVSWAGGYVEPLATRLQQAAIGSLEGLGWGYAFPYVSRFVNAPAGAPNAYVTICACEALLDAAEALSDEALAESALEGARFLLDGLGTIEHEGKHWLRYWPGTDGRIVNVQASGASLLYRVAGRFADGRLSEAAEEAFHLTRAAQRPDGSWPYSDDGRGPFVDGFHTGFVLQSLIEIAERRSDGGAADDALSAGLRFYRERLISSQGLPLGLADGEVSLDPQNTAQCVQTLVISGDLKFAVEVWEHVGARGASPLVLGRGMVALRWALGSGVLAGAHLVHHVRSEDGGVGRREFPS